MFSIGNGIALIALLAWPVVAFVLFQVLRPERALIWTILGGYMLLPQLSAINLPGMPALDKVSIPNLAALMGFMVVMGRLPQLWPDNGLGRVLLVLFVLSPVVTVFTNLDPVTFGSITQGGLAVSDTSALTREALPGLRVYDSVSVLAGQLILMLPLFLARDMLRTESAIREILVALVVAGLFYALPMLWEARFSPQLHTQLYGFFQHNFGQAIRGDGFRPFVFMPHGLWVAFFAFMCLMAAAALLRLAPSGQRAKPLALLGVMAVLLLVCRSMGPILLALMFVPVLLLLSPRLHLRLAAAAALLVIAYPLIRGGGLIPTDTLVQWVAAISPDRAQSLGFRFDNEDLILAHAAEKMLFGWGGWGRFLPHDPLTGRVQAIVDGQWMLNIGEDGWLGYVASFGLLGLPLVMLALRRGPVPLAVSAVALILAANLVDMLPNATLIPFTWLMVGALWGYAEARVTATDSPAQASAPPAVRGGVLVAGQSSDRPGRRTVL